MTEEPQAKRGDAAWKEQRDEIAQRNAAVRREAQAGQKQRLGVQDDRARADMRREREQLEALNARLDKQRSRGSR